MEMMLVGNSKLKVMLTEEDLEEFQLTAESLDYSKTETKRMVWDILGRAKHTVGFDSEGDRILLQLYPSRKGGCELFITKLGIRTCSAEEDWLASEEEAETLSCPAPQIFGFETAEWLVRACKRLLAAGFDADSSAYLCDGRKPLLVLFHENGEETSPLRYAFLSEYGREEDPTLLESYIREHGAPLCPHHAVELLGVL